MEISSFNIKEEKTYEIIAISNEMKVFYAKELKDDELCNIDFFPFLDVAMQDLHLIKKGAIFINKTGYIDFADGSRARVVAQLEFKE